ncbi:phytanoyl-CoA dioxygenase family protein [Actinomadura rupiterrae]|uniref:phytanoyl-CoA dioxygenase family protein n=1 Tax=Actinomadura rupiterrae TaxID=559627 RepID=UPI0020A59F70|nr:phytanoyl-CoA dioxygenase family protein [Actinomadura rupiterrae]MCP2341158.1 ectoine hydroxylase-related dioxygenase (phytanoyl-CoA dioxygenase family) [Actinomadura rupiterrae]
MSTWLRTDTGYRTGLIWADPEHVAPAVRAAGSGPDIELSPHRRHPWARRALTATPILTAVQDRIGPAVAVVEPTLLLRKRPGAFVVPPHQDGISAGFELDADRAVAVWFALTDATAASGCLLVVPGSHHDGYRPHVRAPHDPGRGAPLTLAVPPPDDAFTPVPVPAGQALLMDLRLIHRSDANTTDRPRIGLNAIFAAAGAVHLHHGEPPALQPLTGDWPTT